MRTTIRLDDQLWAETKQFAAKSGRSLNAVVEEAVRTLLSRQSERRGRAPAQLTTVGGQGVRPGVDLDDTAALLDLMDSRGVAG